MCITLAGSLIKLVYFSRHENQPVSDARKKIIKARLGVTNVNRWSYPILGGRLHFVKFETAKINECLDFIYSKQLHRGGTFSLLYYLVDATFSSVLFVNLFVDDSYPLFEEFSLVKKTFMSGCRNGITSLAI